MKSFSTLTHSVFVLFFSALATVTIGQSNQWTWMKGSNSTTQSASYGTQGVESASNTPGGRAGCVSSKDASGNIWVYGGNTLDITGAPCLSDLWKYNVTTNQWVWMKGSSGTNETPVYGTQGAASNLNTPGARKNACSWTDAAGNFWLFGGSNYFGYYYSDLWKYNAATNQWTWVNGSNTINTRGVYGTVGTESAGNAPGARSGALSWVDNSGNMWMFGGYGYATGSGGGLNDLWKYNMSTNQWMWVSGDKIEGVANVWGTKGVAAASNKPGNRNGAMGWADKSGNLWLFGGNHNSSGAFYCSDLWKYNISTNMWTWMKGSNTSGSTGSYGSIRVASSSNEVPARSGGYTATDSLGNFLLFGGQTTDASNNSIVYNDVWRYNQGTNQWTWLKGTAGSGSATVYGTMGVSTTTNSAGLRSGGTSWADAGGNFWMFGGSIPSGVTYVSNEVWRYVPPYAPVMTGFTPTSTAQGTTVTITGTNLDLVTSVTFGGTPAASFTIVNSRTINAVVGAGASGNVTVTSLEGTSTLPGFTFCYTPTITSATAAGTGTTTITANGVSGTSAAVNWWTGLGGTGTNLGSATSIVQGPGTYYARVTGTCGPAVEASVTVIATNQWTWMGGQDSLPQYANYGTLGVSSPYNTPGGRFGATTWTDASGNFWLFGGSGNTTTTNGTLNDLWKYNRTTNEWTWVKGDQTISTAGIYGTINVAADANKPGARSRASGWADGAGNLWLFGGTGSASSGTGSLNDLWKYNIATNMWTWIGGSDIANQLGVYGTQGASASTNQPGARNGTTSWKDASGNFWLFGGLGYASVAGSGYMNDIWKYNVTTKEWTWISGDNTVNQVAVYGTAGTAAPTNKPGGRSGSAGWIDAAGTVWLYGGIGYASGTSSGYLGDLWKYLPSTNQWIFIKGYSVINIVSTYGTQGVPSGSNAPSTRQDMKSWIDASGNLWLLGGFGYDDVVGSFANNLNDLWRYNVATAQWTWVKGDKSVSQSGFYGSLGTGSTAVKPGARSVAAGWTDASGDFWLFGGSGYSANGSGSMNDLFKYNIAANQWTWLKGDTSHVFVGVYGTQGTTAATNQPGGRNGAATWNDSNGDMWLFGGTGSSANGTGYLNDIWKYGSLSKQWTWVKGDNAVNQPGNYGTMGTANAANKPGSRINSVTWTDALGNVWLFGGQGYASTTTSGYLNDLWKYNPATNQWTWISGSNTFNQQGTYGTQAIAAAGNIPGGRSNAVAWTDKAGLVYLFGGTGYATTATLGNLNDFWKYNPSTNQWTWISGDNIINQGAVYGTIAVSNATNKPGSRNGAVNWTDTTGNFWMFGGVGFASTSSGNLNDLWKYSTMTGEWTWMKGNNSISNVGTYGTKGVSAAANKPGGRSGATTWTDVANNLWLMAGSGYGASASGALNDVWRYNLTSNEWTFMSGSSTVNPLSVYGTLRTASGGTPGGRNNSIAWYDGSGFVWLMGGNGYSAFGSATNLNDLWKYVVPNPPTVSSFTPTTAMTGMAVTITGTNFLGATAVSFGTTQALSFTVVNSTTITAVVANGASGNVTVTTPEGTANLAGFTYYAPPVVTTSTGNTSFTEGTSVIADASVAVTDQDNTTLASATVTITTGFQSAEDLLLFTNQNGITGSYNTLTGVLNLTGSATVTLYQTALRSIRYNNTSQNPIIANRTISFVANDGGYNSNPATKMVTITPINTAPIVTASGGNTGYTEGSPIAVDPALDATDPDNINLSSALISITSGFVSTEDVLQFTNQNGITGAYNSITGVLTLSGAASLANYQNALRSIQYNNSSQNPNIANRTVSFTVNDGALNSVAGTKIVTITPVNNAPIATASAGTTTYTEGTNVVIDGAITTTDVDNTTLASATVTITSGVQSAQDALVFTNQNGITGSYNAATGVLSLTGSSSLANYLAALRSIQYSNSSLNPSTVNRTISFVVNDGALNSNTTSKTVTITAVNNPPVLTASAGNTSYFEGTNIAVDAAVTAIDPDNTTLISATAAIVGGFQPAEDGLVFTNQNGITGSYNSTTGVLSLTGSSTVANYQTALRSIQYTNNSPTPNTANRTITFVTNDGSLSSNTVSKIVTVTAVNNIPVTTTSAGSTSYLEGMQVIVDPALTATDADNTTLVSATANITAGFQYGQDALLFTAQNGISGSYNGFTGELTLTGTATVANYQTALRSVYYTNSSTAPNTTNRVVSFTVNDGAANSLVANKTVTVTAINNAPGLNPIADIYVSQNSSARTVGLSGISDGGDGGQTLTITASSSNTAIIPNPAVSYANPNITGNLSFTPVTNALGTSTITVTVTDNGGITNGGVNTFSRTFTVTVAAAPIITSFNPAIASTGTTVTITGTNFNGATAVSFGGTAAASFTVVNNTTITATVGAGSSGSVNVTTPVGTATQAGFTYCVVPSISVQPLASQIVCQNSTPALSVSAAGSGLTYQWFSNTTNSSSRGKAIANATSNTYAPPATVAGTFYYYVVITGTCGTKTSTPSTVIVNAVNAAPALIDFEGAFPSSNVSVLNYDNGKTWQQIFVPGPSGVNTQAAYVNTFDYDAEGEFDDLVLSPYVINKNDYQLVFDRASARYPGSSDRLQVMVSTDCGATFNNIIYDKQGDILATAAASTNSFQPASASDWKRDTLSLASYFGQTVVVKFRLINGYSNNIYLDNIAIKQPCIMPVTTVSANGPTTFCAGGSVTLTASAGASYQWSNGASTAAITVTTSGNYSVTISNASGCSSTSAATSVMVNQPTTLHTTVSVCSSYVWHNTSYTVSGNYAYYTTNAAGCDSVEVLHLTIVNLPSTATVVDVICNAASTGSITIAASSGIAPYQYKLGTSGSYGAASSGPVSFNALRAGKYYIYFKDAAGCISISNPITVAQAPPLTPTATAYDATCYGSATGVIKVAASGGQSPYKYRLGTTGVYSAVDSFTGLKAASNYKVYITDGKGCTGVTAPITVGQSLTAMSVDGVSEPAPCNGTASGVIRATASGGTSPYTYTVGAASNDSGVFKNLKSASYTIYAKDIKGCLANIKTTVNQAAPVILTATSTNPLQPNGNGTITATATGGSGNYWYRNGTAGVYKQSGLFTGLKQGTYRLYAKDSTTGCAALPIAVPIVYTAPRDFRPITSVKFATAEAVDLAIRISPNPASSTFNLNVTGKAGVPVEVRVVDVSGRIMFVAKGAVEDVYSFGNAFTSGVYSVEVRQGDKLKTLKAVKTN